MDEGRHADVVDSVQQFLFLDAHQVHGHLAGLDDDAVFARHLDHYRQRIDVLLFHDALDHGGTHAGHVHLGERQFVRAARHHESEHALDQVFLDLGRIILAQDVQAPEGEEHGDFVAHRSSAIGDDEGRDGFVQVAGENDHGFILGGG